MRFRTFIARILEPQFGGDKKLFSRNTARSQRVADLRFVEIRGSSVDVTVACFNRIDDRALTLGRVDYLKHAKTQYRDLDAIVQRGGIHKAF